MSGDESSDGVSESSYVDLERGEALVTIDNHDTSGRHRSYCFTLNNYEETDEKALKSLVEEGVLSYLIWQRELAPGNTTSAIV